MRPRTTLLAGRGPAAPRRAQLLAEAEAHTQTAKAAEATQFLGRCEGCLHWAWAAADPGGARACMKIKHASESDRVEDAAWVEDAEDYVAILYTKADFGCRLWRARAGDDEEEPDAGH